MRIQMKNFIMTLCLVGASVALAACAGTGDGKTYPAPYAHERTAGGTTAPVAAAEPMFEKKMRK